MTSLSRSRYVQNGGVRIHYRDELPAAGDDGRPPVVFVPGITDLAADYEGIAESLGRRTVVIEVRGHGESDAPPSGYRLEDHVDDIDAVVGDVAGEGPIHLMSFSRGSGYALGWVHRHPERVLSLSIGDYPAREIRLPVSVAETLVAGRWRGTPAAGRLNRAAALAKFEQSRDRPFWDTVADRTRNGVPVLVVRSGAGGPVTDDDWSRYGSLGVPPTMVEFAESPHDIFRPDRTRFPLLVAEHAARGDERYGHRSPTRREAEPR